MIGKIAVYDHMSDKVTRIDVPVPKDGHGGGDDVLMRNFVELMEVSPRVWMML